MEEYTQLGGRKIWLYLPFECAKAEGRVEAITFGPWKLDYTFRWRAGTWKSEIELMSELSGLEPDVIRELREPDAARVITAFLDLVPAEVRADIAAGLLPRTEEGFVAETFTPSPEGPQESRQEDAMAEHGYDLSEEGREPRG